MLALGWDVSINLVQSRMSGVWADLLVSGLLITYL